MSYEKAPEIKLNKNDIVCCVKSEGRLGLEKGLNYLVTNVYPSWQIDVRNLFGETFYNCHPDRFCRMRHLNDYNAFAPRDDVFEKIQPEQKKDELKFKVGDRVKDKTSRLPGIILKIEECWPDDTYPYFIKFDGMGSTWKKESELEKESDRWPALVENTKQREYLVTREYFENKEEAQEYCVKFGYKFIRILNELPSLKQRLDKL